MSAKPRVPRRKRGPSNVTALLDAQPAVLSSTAPLASAPAPTPTEREIVVFTALVLRRQYETGTCPRDYQCGTDMVPLLGVNCKPVVDAHLPAAQAAAGPRYRVFAVSPYFGKTVKLMLDRV